MDDLLPGAPAFMRRLLDHAAWADARLLDALRAAAREAAGASSALAEAVREYAHVIGAAETWLARLEGRPARCAIWPELGLDEAAALGAALRDDWARWLGRNGGLDDATLAGAVRYRNSQGTEFVTPVADVLAQVALHGQYHRGKINLLLRQAGAAPAPADFIAFARAGAASGTPVRR